MFAVSQTRISPNNKEASAIEQYRACHRRICRDERQFACSTSSAVESLDVDEGRTRKVSAKWRLKRQLQSQSSVGYDDGNWPKAAGTEMHIGYNAFDFSSCPEALYDMEVPQSQGAAELSPSENNQQYRSASIRGNHYSTGSSMLNQQSRLKVPVHNESGSRATPKAAFQ
ncbi:unnamed protein product [Phytophthora lilii]|uniref:Unnamed protein product n=1 Tax=Phytophthora lilii TaxID=2077276 RepID=A0A9W6TNA3_9STRA|nr:unnamed protein product [Phytophthora lilii]